MRLEELSVHALPGAPDGHVGGTRVSRGGIERGNARSEALTGPPYPRTHCAHRGLHHGSNVLIRTAVLDEQPKRCPFVER
jgi:hypothetical protein